MAQKSAIQELGNAQYNALCRVIWRETNAKYFGSRLLRCPYFRIVDNIPFGGYHVPTHAKRDLIVINRAAPAAQDLDSLISLVIHEMIHQEQWQHPSKYIKAEHHGRFFRRRAAEIVNAGFGYDVVSMYPKRKMKRG